MKRRLPEEPGIEERKSKRLRGLPEGPVFELPSEEESAEEEGGESESEEEEEEEGESEPKEPVLEEEESEPKEPEFRESTDEEVRERKLALSAAGKGDSPNFTEAANRYEALVNDLDDEETAQHELENFRQDALRAASKTPDNLAMIALILEQFANLPWTLFYPPDETLRYILDKQSKRVMNLLNDQFSEEPQFWADEVEDVLKTVPESDFTHWLRSQLVHFPEQD